MEADLEIYIVVLIALTKPKRNNFLDILFNF